MAYGKIDPKLEYSGRRMMEAVDYCVNVAIAPLADEIMLLRLRVAELERERGSPGTGAEAIKENTTQSPVAG
jgi:hypothetical protein